MRKIGLITIGQAPRTDMMGDLEPIFDDQIEILQRGALDHLTCLELADLAPEKDDTVLVSCLRDGTPVIMAEEKIIGLLQACIDDLQVKGAGAILFLCTGDFKDALKAKIPLIYPNRLLQGLLPVLCEDKRLTVLVPDEEQRAEAMAQWSREGLQVEVLSISPYEAALGDFKKIAKQIKTMESHYVLLDCMGYSSEMKHLIEEGSEKIVLLPRTLSAVIAKELTS